MAEAAQKAGLNANTAEVVASAIADAKASYRFSEIKGMYEGAEAMAKALEIVHNHRPSHGAVRIATFDLTNDKITSAIERIVDLGTKIYLPIDGEQYEQSTPSLAARTRHRQEQLLRRSVSRESSSRGRADELLDAVDLALLFTGRTDLYVVCVF